MVCDWQHMGKVECLEKSFGGRSRSEPVGLQIGRRKHLRSVRAHRVRSVSAWFMSACPKDGPARVSYSCGSGTTTCLSLPNKEQVERATIFQIGGRFQIFFQNV